MKTSLIYTVFNRNSILRKSLLKMITMTLPDELVIVDDGSSDNVLETCKEIRKLKPELPIVYIYHNNPTWDSCSIPKNIGLQQAKGDILIYSEPEVMFISDIIKQMKEYLWDIDQKHVITAGQMYFGKLNSEPFPEHRLKDPLKYIEEYGVNEWKPGTVDLHGGEPTYTFAKNLDATWVLGVMKNALMKISGWDEDMSASRGGGAWGFEDTEILTRLRIKGYGQFKYPEMIAVHQWHNRPPQWIQDSWDKNEELMKKKGYNGNEYPEHPDLRANKDRPWGALNGERIDL